MEEEIDIEHMISLISQRPVLWDKSLKEYHNRVLVTEAWREVCLELNTDFTNLDDQAKNVYGKLIVKKWRNVRDNWMKSCKRTEGAMKSGSGAKKIKTYVYQEQLAFLKKTCELKDTESSFSPNSPEAQSEETTNPGDTTAKNNDPPSQTKEHRFVTPTEKKSKSYHEKKSMEKSILEALKEEDDPKLMFLKSLLPNISDFSNDEFLHFQCRILQIIQDIKRERMPYNHPPPTPPPMSGQYGWQGSAPAPGFSGWTNQEAHQALQYMPNQTRGHRNQTTRQLVSPYSTTSEDNSVVSSPGEEYELEFGTYQRLQ